MPRTLTVLFRRDPSRDRQRERIHFEGYQIFWPNGRPMDLGIDAFCGYGQKLLGLGKFLAGCTEKMVDMLCFSLKSIDDPLTRLPGCRVRRFYLERQGNIGRIHLFNGIPTESVFEIGRDEPKVLNWIGLPSVPNGGQSWIDLAARPSILELPAALPRKNREKPRPVLAGAHLLEADHPILHTNHASWV